MTLEKTLVEHAFSRGLTGPQVVSLLEVAGEVTFNEDQVILVHGQRSDFFYLLTEGSVVVELRAPSFSVCVQELGPGDVFGWSALLDQQDTLFHVRARERTTALRLPGEKLRAICRDDAQLGAELLTRVLRVVAGRVKATEVRFAEMCGVRV
jgi:CRP-like cAMP-binding protein